MDNASDAVVNKVSLLKAYYLRLFLDFSLLNIRKAFPQNRLNE
jgi:hypothetical protein